MPSLQAILSNPNGDLEKLLQGVRQIQAIDALVQKYLPDDLKKYVRAVNVNQGKLIVEVENPSWAAKLRFFLPELLSNLRKVPELAGLKSIETKMSAKEHKSLKSKKSEPSHFHLSYEAAQTLKNCIDNTSDNQLKKALKKFLQHYG
jgi:hypothetical protein